MRAKETRRGPRAVAEALREAANRGPSELVTDGAPRAREPPCGYAARGYGSRGRVGAAQIGSVVEGHTTGQLYVTMRFTVAKEHRSFEAKRQAPEGWCRNHKLRDETHTTCRVYGAKHAGKPGCSADDSIQPLSASVS